MAAFNSASPGATAAAGREVERLDRCDVLFFMGSRVV